MPLETKKLNENPNIIKESDCCETPKYALPMLLKYIPQEWRIWESACGSGRLIKSIQELGYSVSLSSDLCYGEQYNYFNYNPSNYDIELTNIPFSIQIKWIERAIKRGYPFAFIVPLRSLEQKMSRIVREHGLQMIKPDQRIEFYMPHEGWWKCYECGQYHNKEKFDQCPKCDYVGEKIRIVVSSPQIQTMWVTYQLNLPKDFILVDNAKNMEVYPR